jgi:hypothetical protein
MEGKYRQLLLKFSTLGRKKAAKPPVLLHFILENPVLGRISVLYLIF